MDDILNVPERLVVSAGSEPSRFAGATIKDVLDFLTYHGIAGETTYTELRCTVPLADHRTSITMMAAGRTPPTSSIEILTDVPHPEAGNGALVLMWVTDASACNDAAAVANALNAAEATGASQVPLLGAWCPDPNSRDQGGVAFCSFLPNLIARQGMLENQVIYQRNRSTFASQWFSVRGEEGG
jgi:hypothetical protein